MAWGAEVRSYRHGNPINPAMKPFASFAVKVTTVQAVTYIVAGMIAFPLFTREFFEGTSPLLAPLR